jgi:dTDP-4-amino-4,6-dideoxygalactose transaminase
VVGIRVPINKPFFGEEEAREVHQLVIGGTLTTSATEGGRKVREFEEGLRKLLRCKDVIAVNSGTSALMASLMALGVGPGDEVIVPSFTFAATANSVRAVGATPVFADVRLSDYTMDPDDVKRKVTSRTKAVVPVHLYGHVADVKAIREAVGGEGVSIVEDAAQSLGSTSLGVQTGTMGDVGCFSFYPSKVISTGEGGAISTNDVELGMKLRMVRNHGMVKGYDTTVLGLNLRMPEMEAAIGVEQLKRLEGFIEARRRNAQQLTRSLERAEGIRVPREEEGKRFNWYLYTIFVKEGRDRLLRRLRERGYGATVYYDPPVHRTPYYRVLSDVKLPVTDEASAHVLSLPIHPFVTEADIDEMANLIKADEKA